MSFSGLPPLLRGELWLTFDILMGLAVGELILRLGLAEHDLGVVLDPESGRALTAAHDEQHRPRRIKAESCAAGSRITDPELRPHRGAADRHPATVQPAAG